MEKSAQYVGPSFLSILGIVFIVLKLTGIIAWSWWWVLAPFWAPLVLVFFIAVPLVYLIRGIYLREI